MTLVTNKKYFNFTLSNSFFAEMFTIREYQARMEEIKLYLYEEFP